MNDRRLEWWRAGLQAIWREGELGALFDTEAQRHREMNSDQVSIPQSYRLHTFT